ncbi:MAG: GntR family transcriptional regulator [Microbacteriaceae bacterium]
MQPTPLEIPGKREPAYARIERYLWSLLDEGAGVTDPMPSEVELARRFGVSIMTARQAYTQLVNSGAVVRERFKGTWAATHITDDLGQLSGRTFPTSWAEQGAEVVSEVLVFDRRVAPRHIARRFDAVEGSEFTYLERLRRANGQPVAWDTRWMPSAIFDETTADDFERMPVFTVLAQHGVTCVTMQSDISARLADALHASALEISKGDPLLVRQSIATDDADGIALVMTSLYPANRFTFRSTASISSSTFADH